MEKEVRGKTILYRVEESGVEYPGGRGSGAAQLKRKKLEIQRRTLELAERDKRDKGILFYNSEINSSLPAIQQQKLLEMKLEIKARYNLDY
ncbi:hypothetical protein Tco_1098380 [Tanacetum coccineum]